MRIRTALKAGYSATKITDPIADVPRPAMKDLLFPPEETVETNLVVTGQAVAAILE